LQKQVRPLPQNEMGKILDKDKIAQKEYKKKYFRNYRHL
jgi:hypothetical protein